MLQEMSKIKTTDKLSLLQVCVILLFITNLLYFHLYFVNFENNEMVL